MTQWIRIDCDMPDNPKVAAYAALMGIDQVTALGALVRLFSWAKQHEPSGSLKHVAPAMVANAMGLTRDMSAHDDVVFDELATIVCEHVPALREVYESPDTVRMYNRIHDAHASAYANGNASAYAQAMQTHMQVHMQVQYDLHMQVHKPVHMQVHNSCMDFAYANAPSLHRNFAFAALAHLHTVCIIDDDLQIRGWDERQFQAAKKKPERSYSRALAAHKRWKHTASDQGKDCVVCQKEFGGQVGDAPASSAEPATLIANANADAIRDGLHDANAYANASDVCIPDLHPTYNTYNTDSTNKKEDTYTATSAVSAVTSTAEEANRSQQKSLVVGVANPEPAANLAPYGSDDEPPHEKSLPWDDREPQPVQPPAANPVDGPSDPTAAQAKDGGPSTTKPKPDPVATPGFETFWEQYPKRNGRKVGKLKAANLWAKMPQRERDLAAKALDNYRAECGDYAMNPDRWLRKTKDGIAPYHEYLEPAEPTGTTKHQVDTQDPEEWDFGSW